MLCHVSVKRDLKDTSEPFLSDDLEKLLATNHRILVRKKREDNICRDPSFKESLWGRKLCAGTEKNGTNKDAD